MLPRPPIFFSSSFRAAWLASTVLLLATVATPAAHGRHNIVCREELSPAHREQLATNLRRITGLPDLKFDDNGTLRFSSDEIAGGSSASARELLSNAADGPALVVIEDASNNSEVAFCRVIPGRWKNNIAHSRPVFVVQIDFEDFNQVVGDERALAAFNAGWGLLHELDHVVHDSSDADELGETGACEAHINQMRRECDLPERAGYFFTISPLATDTTFTARLVRLAFEEQKPSNKKKRYWLLWDVNVVGGLAPNQIAALRQDRP